MFNSSFYLLKQNNKLIHRDILEAWYFLLIILILKVGDIHRILIKGGIFLYPKDSKAPKGKLRLLYELYPLGLIIERCGGLAIDDDGTRILNK